MGYTFNKKEFSGQYQRMLKEYLDTEEEEALHNAYEVGRTALAFDISLLDLNLLHQESLEELLLEKKDRLDGNRMMDQCKAAGRFLGEVMSPYELSRLSNKDVNSVLPRLYEAKEKEAKRIAHVLHDDAAQMLAIAYMEINEIAREVGDQQKVLSKVEEVLSHLDEVRNQLRSLSHELRPMILDQLGLIPALNFLARRINGRNETEVSIHGDTDGRLPQNVEVVMYRVVQEALSNVIKHANASRVDVEVSREQESLYCRISDDGVGFDLNNKNSNDNQGIGLIGMQERVSALGGQFNIDTGPGQGTMIKVAIPL